jgi:hypothetical protein
MIAYILIIIGAVARLLPHMPNFTPVGALALFGGAKLKNKYAAILAPVAIMAMTDFYLGFHKLILFTWGSMALVALIGFWVRKKYGLGRIALGTLAGSILFFVITNFGVYLEGWYGYNFSGLVQTYVMAIPFFRNSLMGDVFYSAVFFGCYELVIYWRKKYLAFKVAGQVVSSH